ncbi:hypothetical protein, conserved [Eimeria tenella]|uniref:Transmembrane protein n=1 Tax=Eimeria tenella TaxID=5802 RepID=U6KN44_EIMTE|nr:hypothetical protein, conserved [Eimeria tenella]CDJ38256.1 hypothetical protein, conserved [Eimeria tenella]|eukprot:XP_013229094.1 hypothetical protein, conserved [Eimeria tenella]
MTFFTCTLQLLLFAVSLLIPTLVAVRMLSAAGRDAAAAAAATRLLEYFLLVCCLQHLLSSFPVSVLLRVLPTSLLLLLKLAAAAALAAPALGLPSKVLCFATAHYEEYLKGAAAAAEEKILKPLKANVQHALDMARQRTQ